MKREYNANIKNYIINIENILKIDDVEYECNILEFKESYDKDNIKKGETFIFEENNIEFNITCFTNYDIDNKDNILINMLKLNNSDLNLFKKYKIIKEIILEKIKKRYKDKIDKANNKKLKVYIKIHLKTNNDIKIIILV